MITQTIARWLNKLFAWWPWKRASAGEYPQAVNNLNKGMTQEQGWRMKVEGPVPQPGSMSVAVEQEMGEPAADTHRLSSDEHSEHVPPLSPSKANDPLVHPRAPLSDAGQEQVRAAHPEEPAPTSEQQLAFLHYLVKRGIVNEGFPPGNIPRQYRQEK